MSFTTQNHYVPQWYQKRFYPSGCSEKRLFYLDLSPEKRVGGNGKPYTLKAIRRLGTELCFKEEHLYTLFFKGVSSDIVERKFFGNIDHRGTPALEFISNYSYRTGAHEAFHDFLCFMDAQKIRTPKGLDFLQKETGILDNTILLHTMRNLWLLHNTIWCEGVWEVVNCFTSGTKFLLSDHPVVTYNKKLFPNSVSCRYPNDAEIERIGTHTIFPLDLNRCLIITNLGYVRNPKINPLKLRENPRYFEETIKDLRRIQTGREISEQDVLSINYILKNRAKKYIASHSEVDLYPEKYLCKKMWNKLGSKHFLFPDPRKIHFSTGTYVGQKDGSVWAQDEYGRIPNDKSRTVNLNRDKEWLAFHSFRRSWDGMYGPLTKEELKELY